MPPQIKPENPPRDTLLVIMPALNEKDHIETTINSWLPVIKNFANSKIIVIDGGSQDGTQEKLVKMSRKYKFLKVFNQKDKGHGNAIIQGYKIAIDSKHPWVFQTDADGHFDPSDFYKLWEKKGSSHFIIGHRLNRKDPMYRIALSRFISLWILILFNEKIKDPNIPYRLIKTDYLKEIIKKVQDGVFAPNIFLSILAARDGQNLYNVPVSDKNGKKTSSISKRKLLKASLQGFKEIITFRVKTKL